MRDGRKPDVVYIMGAGRSGSTLLGVALGNLSDVFYGGELFAWNHFGGEPITEDAELRAFWRSVKDRVPEATHHVDRDFFRQLEHPSSLLRIRSQLDARLARDHAEHNMALFAEIRRATGCQVVVDSSHFPLRARRLGKMSGLDVRVVHLVRDPRSVVGAFRKDVQRHEPMSWLRANLYCLVVELLSAIVHRGFPRAKRVTVRYEDLVDAPERTISRLASALGLDGELPDFADLRTGFVFQGNRIRHQRSVAVRAGAVRTTLPFPWNAVTTALQAPVLLRHGYWRGR